jgi:hypothetical protein
VGGPAHGSVLSCGGAPRSDPISFPSSKPSPLYKHHHPAPRNHQFLHSQPPPLPTPNLIRAIHPQASTMSAYCGKYKGTNPSPPSPVHLVGCSGVVDLLVGSMFPMLRSSCAPLENLSVFSVIC